MNSFLRGLHSKPITNIMMHIEEVRDVKMELLDFVVCKDGPKYKVLRIADIDIFMTENQAEKLFEIQEKALYEESFKDMEDKYMSEKLRREKLEEEIDYWKEKYFGGF